LVTTDQAKWWPSSRQTLVKHLTRPGRHRATTIVGHAPLFVIGVDTHARTHMLAVLACISAIQ